MTTLSVIDTLVMAVATKEDNLKSLPLANKIKKVWLPLITPFIEEMLTDGFNLEDGTYNNAAIKAIVKKHRKGLTKGFVDATADMVEDSMDSFYTGGLTSFLNFMLSKKDVKFLVQKDMYSDLEAITGSSRKNVMRTIRRWHKKTQGMYFDRFILIEIERIKSLLDAGEMTYATLNKIGRNYKTFCEANGYWNSVSAFNAHTAEVFASIDGMYETNVTHYMIEAVNDKLTCAQCIHMDGTEFTVERAMEIKADLLIRGEDELTDAYPFPGRDLSEKYPDAAESPYAIPPYHPSCRCRMIPTQYEKFTTAI